MTTPPPRIVVVPLTEIELAMLRNALAAWKPREHEMSTKLSLMQILLRPPRLQDVLELAS